MAESKTYRGQKRGYYTIPNTPGRHEGGDFDLLVGPIDTVKKLGMQNNPGESDGGQFGRRDGKSEAD